MHESLRDLVFLTETWIEDLEFLMRRIQMDRAWEQVTPGPFKEAKR